MSENDSCSLKMLYFGGYAATLGTFFGVASTILYNPPAPVSFYNYCVKSAIAARNQSVPLVLLSSTYVATVCSLENLRGVKQPTNAAAGGVAVGIAAGIIHSSVTLGFRVAMLSSIALFTVASTQLSETRSQH